MKFSLITRALFLTLLIGSSWAATFGTVVAIGGHASDIALDEPRGVLYIANFTANRIDVMSLTDYSVKRSISVADQPSSLSVSPDGKFLVVVHFGNVDPKLGLFNNALSLINLQDNSRRTFGLNSPPLGVAFGSDGLAFVVTTTDFQLLDPATGVLRELDTIKDVAAKTLPVALATFPPQIITASLGVSADSSQIFGLSDTLKFSYNVTTKRVVSLGY